MKTPTRRIMGTLLAVALTAGLAPRASAQQEKKTPTVAGAWNLSLQGDHVVPVGMELKQEGTKVTGVILMPTQRIGERHELEMVGEFVDGTLKLASVPEPGNESTKLELSAKLDEDGVLTGSVANAAGHGAQFTGERLKPRK